MVMRAIMLRMMILKVMILTTEILINIKFLVFVSAFVLFVMAR